MRTRTWDTDLLAWAETVLGRPFQWGVTDCGSLVITGQRIIHQRDVFGLSPWKSKAKALRVLAASPMATVLAAHAEPVGRAFLQTGDIALVPDGCEALQSDGLMLVIRDYALATAPEHIVTRIPFDAIPDGASYWRTRVD